MKHLEVSGAVRPIYGSLGVKRLTREKRDSFVTESPPPLHQLRASVCTLFYLPYKKYNFYKTYLSQALL